MRAHLISAFIVSFVSLGAAAALFTAGAIAAEDAPTLRAGDDACLQNNRLWSWNVVDRRTLSITDRTYKRFIVRVAGGCVGLSTSAVTNIEIRSFAGSLSCVRRGDFVRFVDPTLGRLSCVIVSVERELPRPRAR